jgi:DNA-binding GntR family transcriptional regulator
MSNAGVANINNVLANVKDQAAPSLAPTDAVLRVLRERKRVALPELAAIANLSPTVCFEAVERLRSQELVEIVQLPESEQFYIQLTSAGYATFAS